jgi:thiol-disulfide isomerase/thioredoxin
MRHAYLALLAAAIVLGSCSRPTRLESASASDPSDSSRVARPSDGVALSVRDGSPEKPRPWYADRFEALGFFVFPEPTEIPGFSVRPLSGGGPVGPEDFKGSVTLLNFWATWCPPCRQEMPSIETLHKKLAGESFRVAAVNVREKAETVSAFLKQNPYTYPIYLDPTGAASANFVSRGIPTTFVLDKDAKAVAAIIGSRSYAEPEIVELFREMARR